MKFTILMLSALLLSACQTFSGLSQDFSALTTRAKEITILESPEEKAMNEAMALENPICPPVIIDPELNRLTEFYDSSKTTEKTKVSSVLLSRADSTCTQGDEYLTLKIDLAFDGTLGPKARRKSGDQPFYAYPYFISVKDNEGNEIVKELFAASMTYSSKQDKQSVIETIRQQLPYNDDGTLPSYQIHVGLQLTEDQLFYNASL